MRVVLDNKLNTKLNSYIIKTANNRNTIIFYNKADKLKISKFKKKGVKLIKADLSKDNRFNIKVLLKKLNFYQRLLSPSPYVESRINIL